MTEKLWSATSWLTASFASRWCQEANIVLVCGFKDSKVSLSVRVWRWRSKEQALYLRAVSEITLQICSV